MRTAEWIVDASARLERLAENQSKDTDEMYLIVGRALMHLLHERRSFELRASAAELHAALAYAAPSCDEPLHRPPRKVG